jgi:NADPH:quinone reductase-like Zn-dependent oxidoreductase
MLAMNMLDIPEQRLGLEFSGVIVSLGSKVSKFKVGDSVYGFAKNGLASHVVANETLIVKKPAHLTHEESCSIPAVFVTSYYSLVYKACNMQKGQTLLVHSAAGGVGQSAIQISMWLQGNVIASDKRWFNSFHILNC